MRMRVTLNSLVIITGLLLSTTLQAALTLSVDRNPVGMDESFTLTLSSDGSVDGEPDFSWLEREFEVVNQQQSSNFQMINGDVSRSITWNLTLLAKKSGNFVLPPIRVGDQQSNRITLRVKERAAASTAPDGAANNEALFVLVEAGQAELYVQEQLLYTIKLFLAHDAGLNIANGSSLSEPELASGDAVIKRLGEDSNYQTMFNGKRYSVIERRYAIYPQQSGELSIKPILFDGRMVTTTNRRQSIFDSLQQRSQIKRVTSKGVTREVKAIPAGYTGKQWLPAKSVQLVEEWPEQQGLVVGEPVTRTLALLVDGITSAQLPTLNMATPEGLKSYPDQPLLKETTSAQGITALRQEKIALVATAPGELTLPALEVTWWNTDTGKQEVARLDARTIKVKAAAGGSEPQAMPPAVSGVQQAASQPLTAIAEPKASPLAATTGSDRRWQWLALVLAAGWLFTLLLWWRSTRQSNATPAAKVEAIESLKAVRKKVKAACHSGNASETKEALMGWAQSQWPDAAPASLGELARRVSGELAAAIDELSRVLYSGAKSEWRGEPLWEAFNAPRSGKSTASPPSELAPLFRHQ